MFELLLGHLAGDYLLQNEWMALNKSKNTLTGWLAAFVHSIIYTLAVCLFMWNFDLIWILIVFLSHFPIDKFSLAEYYLKLIRGRSLRDYIKKDYSDNPIYRPQLNRIDILEGSFSAVVYTVTDNTMHLILMWGAYNLIY